MIEKHNIKRNYLVIFLSSIFSLSLLGLVSHADIGIQLTPQCYPTNQTSYFICKFFNLDLPVFINSFEFSLNLEDNNTFVNNVIAFNLERQREHFILLQQLKNNSIDGRTFGQLQSQLVIDINDDLNKINLILSSKQPDIISQTQISQFNQLVSSARDQETQDVSVINLIILQTPSNTSIPLELNNTLIISQRGVQR